MAVAGRLEELERPSLLARVRSSPAVAVFVWSRAAVWLAVLLAYLWFEPNAHPLVRERDNPYLHDAGWAVDIWGRWDSTWLLRIAEHSYATDPAHAPAFFPLYPSLLAVLGRVLAGHFLVAGLLVSLASCLAAFVLLDRLAEL